MKAENNKQSQSAEDKTVNTGGDVIARDKSGKKTMLFAAIGAVLVLLAAIIIAVNIFGDSGGKLQEQLDLGAKYLEEMDYEQALVAFNAVLSIEPKNVDAYLGIVEVYIRTNDFENALKYAREGYEATGDGRLKEKIDMLEGGDISASNGWIMKRLGYDGEGNLVYWHEYTYNLEGKRASVAKYNARGEQEQYLELAYDGEGRILIGDSFEYTEGNLFKYTREYNGNGYRETWYKGISDEVRDYKEIETDSDGKILRETDYGEDGSVSGAAAYEYNEDGKLIKRAYYDANNELSYYYIHTYDEEGRPLQEQLYSSNDELMGYFEDVYDEEGNNIGHREYDANGELRSESVTQ